MKKRILSLLLAVVLLVGMLPMAASATPCVIASDKIWAMGFDACRNAGLDTYGWENNLWSSWWGQASGHNCTNYVAYRLSRAGASNFMREGWADAWPDFANWVGHAVNNTPKPGSIAWWGSDGGHVAVVEKVNPTYLVISQDAYYPPYNNFNYAFIDKGHSVTTWPDSFIHVPELENEYSGNSGGGSTSDNYSLEAPFTTYLSYNNAVVGSKITNGRAAVRASSFGFQIWEKYSGKLLYTHKEAISSANQGYTYIDIWLDLADELGLWLSPNTAYEYQFSAEVNGKTYQSAKSTLITYLRGDTVAGGDDAPPQKPANVKLTASTAECKAGDTVTLNFSVTDGISAKGARYFQLLQNGAVLKDKLTAISTSVTLSKAGEYTFTLRAVNDVGTTESAAVKVVVTEKDGEQELAPEPYPGTPFTDISSHWGKENIKWAYENKLFSGISETKFAPEQKMNRGMLATVLWRLAGQPGNNAKFDFSDVPANAYYAKAVAWAAQNSVVSGVGKGKYDPSGNITREQLVTMLYRYAKPSYSLNEAALSSFTDGGQVSKYAKEAMCWAIENRILSGKGNGRLDPQGSATRAEVAAIINRYVNG